MLKHPFVAKAPDRKILASLVKKCMPDIQLVRESRADSDGDEDEDGSSDSSGSSSSSNSSQTETRSNFNTVRSTEVSTQELRDSQMDSSIQQMQQQAEALQLTTPPAGSLDARSI